MRKKKRTRRIIFIWIPLLILILLLAGIFLLKKGYTYGLRKAAAAGSEEAVAVSQTGYLTKGRKTAVFPESDAESRFFVTDISGKVVYEGSFSKKQYSALSKETVCIADFTGLQTAGVYKIVSEAGTESPGVIIGDKNYSKVMKSALRMFYLQRCGTEVEDSVFSHPACHLKSALIYGTDKYIDVSGGWHDAGDYGRYTVAGAKAATDLLLAYRNAPEMFDDECGIPESGNGVPDILDEVRYELDWMLKMQNISGGVYHKVTCADFAETVMPQDEMGTLYVTPVSSTATADFCGTMALASMVFRSVDAEAADTYLQAALRAGEWLDANPRLVFGNPRDIATGAYDDNSDRDERYFAYSALLAATGDSRYENTALKYSGGNGMDTANMEGYGNIMVLTAAGLNTDSNLYKRAKTAMLQDAEILVDGAESSPYGAALANYYWGSNMNMAAAGTVFSTSYALTGDSRYIRSSIDVTGYLFGINPLHMCFVTGNGTKSAVQPHHRPSIVKDKAMPGMLTGGVNENLEDPVVKAYSSDEPVLKRYVDDHWSYSTNEVAIYWNSALVLLLSSTGNPAYVENVSWDEGTVSLYGMLPRFMRSEAVRHWGIFALATLAVLLVFLILYSVNRAYNRTHHPTYDDLFDRNDPIFRKTGKEARRFLMQRIFILISGFFAIMYLAWRAAYSLPLGSGILPVVLNVILLIVELIGFAETMIHYRNLLGIKNHQLPEIKEEEYPEVDIFIATYNEPEDLLMRTINGCKHLRYPDMKKVHVWICDDNRRKNIRELAERMGVGYFDRPDNKGAKAGNLNAAMERTTAPYVVTLDADMIVRSDFLMKTMPYFVDAEKRNAERPEGKKIPLGFIQTPQYFYDPDLFQHALYSEHRAPNEQNYFYQTIEPARTSTNSVIYGGSNTILSRKALNDIGCFYTGSITEDFATGMLIEAAGYVSLGLPEPLASGQTPHSFSEHIKQRTRWGRGVIVTARKLKLFRQKKLSLEQKFSYWESVSYWHFPIKNLVCMLMPLIYALLMLPVFRCTMGELIVFWLPMFLMQSLCLRVVSRGSISTRWSGIHETSVTMHMFFPIVQELLGISLSAFKVTDKSGSGRKREKNTRAMIPFLIMIALSVASAVRLIFFAKDIPVVNNLVVLFWIFRNLYFFVMALFLIDGRDSDGENVDVRDAEPVVLKKKSKKAQSYEGVTTQMNEHRINLFVDEREGLRIGDQVSVNVSNGRTKAELSGVVIGIKEDRRESYGVITVEILDYGTDEQEYWQILYDRIPTLPMTLQDDRGALAHFLRNIRVRLAIES